MFVFQPVFYDDVMAKGSGTSGESQRRPEKARLVATLSSLFDGRKFGPVRSGTTSKIKPALSIFSDHVEYHDSFVNPRRLDKAEIEEVDVKPRIAGGVVVFRRRSEKSIVECGFRTTARLQEALTVLKESGFPLSDGALASLTAW